MKSKVFTPEQEAIAKEVLEALEGYEGFDCTHNWRNFFCNYGEKFKILWRNNRSEIKELAKIFLKKRKIKVWEVGSESKTNNCLFVCLKNYSDRKIRLKFLKWLKSQVITDETIKS